MRAFSDEQPAQPEYKVAVFGGSAGSLSVLERLLAQLQGQLGLPMVVVMHTGMDDQSLAALRLSQRYRLPVLEAEHGAFLEAGRVYLAPANYHLLIEADLSIALSVDSRVSFARPSIDVTLDSTGFALRSAAIGILVSGSNDDGAKGLSSLIRYGGQAMIQSPSEAGAARMPEAAMAACPDAFVGGIDEIARKLRELANPDSKVL